MVPTLSGWKNDRITSTGGTQRRKKISWKGYRESALTTGSLGKKTSKHKRIPIMMMYDRESTAVCPFTVGKKGVQDWVVRKLAKELEGWGLVQCK